MVNDLTFDVGLGDYFGTDVDAVTFECPGGRAGAGIAVSGQQQGNAVGLPIDGAIGVPDAPCEPLDVCAATTGSGGWLAIELPVDPLSGCTVTVHEVADGAQDVFEVWHCLTEELNAGCNGPLARGADGESVSWVIP